MKQKLTCLLIDDIYDVLEMLDKDVTRLFPYMEIIGKAKSVVEAAKIVSEKQPDIIFLDIILGNETGFDLLEIFPKLKSKIIFITASDEYAIKAFNFAAIDYILKPYSDSILKNAVEKALKILQPSTHQLEVLQDVLQTTKKPSKISLHTQEKIVIVEIDTIIRCESDNNYTMFYLSNNQKILVSKTLKTYVDLLKDLGFIRVHQSHLINIKFIKEFIKSDGGYLLLTNKKTIPVSVRKKAEVISAIKKF